MSKRLLFLVLLFPLVTLTASAQKSKAFEKTDSISITALHATAALVTRGYGEYKTLSRDFVDYQNRWLLFKFTKTTDSIALFGMWNPFGDATTKDTVWVPIPLRKHLTAALDVGAGSKSVRDTIVYWATPIGNDNLTPMYYVDTAPFSTVRIAAGKQDSGKIHYSWRTVKE